jgi:hypothetical protein
MAHFPVRTHNQKAVLGVALRFSVLAVIAVNLRLVAHTIVHKGRTSSNYLIVAACVRSVGILIHALIIELRFLPLVCNLLALQVSL